MRHFGSARCVLLALGGISIPVIACLATSVAASPQTRASIGKELAELKGSDSVAGNRFGTSVALSGTTAVVGASGWLPSNGDGRAYVFTKTLTGWRQAAELKGSDSAAGDRFGASVAISGTTAVVGAPNHAKDAGRAYVFTRTAAGWKQTAELRGFDTVAGDYFGQAVEVSGTTVVVGASGHARLAGRAYVFARTAAGWKQTTELKGPDNVAGDYFGYSVAISGTTIVVGAAAHADQTGMACVFTKTATGWEQAAELDGSDTGAGGGWFGESVAISGSSIIVGADNQTSGAGRAYVFTKTAAGWRQAAKLKGSDTVAGDQFGGSVTISGPTAVVGAIGHANFAGRAYVFARSSIGWEQVAELKGSDTSPGGDWFGASVAFAFSTVLVGAPLHAMQAGRAYMFTTRD